MITVKANDISVLSLGRQGDNLARQVIFDVSDLMEEYGPGDNNGSIEVIR